MATASPFILFPLVFLLVQIASCALNPQRNLSCKPGEDRIQVTNRGRENGYISCLGKVDDYAFYDLRAHMIITFCVPEKWENGWPSYCTGHTQWTGQRTLIYARENDHRFCQDGCRLELRRDGWYRRNNSTWGWQKFGWYRLPEN